MALTNTDIAVDLDNYSPPMDLERLFGGSEPIHIEVGAGKGTFLLNQARSCPEVNYLGIEWANKYYRYSVERMRRWQVPNVRILRTDARYFIERYLPDECVNTYHIYFPDPWPKKRHHKRRFFLPDNLAHLVRSLVIGGELRTTTDHAEYFEIIRNLLLPDSTSAALFEPIDFLPANTAHPGEWVGSNFERKYLKQDRPIYTLAVRKL
ncbi:tRNA (guanosine(46)-N7)-methyltransferase TrmB [Planctomycetota bacterium]